MTHYLPILNPTEQQAKINNGMTEKKLAILNKKLEDVATQRRLGRLSTARAYEAGTILIRDILIYRGQEPAYLQG